MLGHRAKELFLENTGATAKTLAALQELINEDLRREDARGAGNQ
jgi:hypothetical protein